MSALPQGCCTMPGLQAPNLPQGCCTMPGLQGLTLPQGCCTMPGLQAPILPQGCSLPGQDQSMLEAMVKTPCPWRPWSCFHPGVSSHALPRCTTGSESGPLLLGVLPATGGERWGHGMSGGPCVQPPACCPPALSLSPEGPGEAVGRGSPLLSPTARLLPLREMFLGLAGRCKRSFGCRVIKTWQLSI